MINSERTQAHWNEWSNHQTNVRCGERRERQRGRKITTDRKKNCISMIRYRNGEKQKDKQRTDHKAKVFVFWFALCGILHDVQLNKIGTLFTWKIVQKQNNNNSNNLPLTMMFDVIVRRIGDRDFLFVSIKPEPDCVSYEGGESTHRQIIRLCLTRFRPARAQDDENRFDGSNYLLNWYDWHWTIQKLSVGIFEY